MLEEKIGIFYLLEIFLFCIVSGGVGRSRSAFYLWIFPNFLNKCSAILAFWYKIMTLNLTRVVRSKSLLKKKKY